VEAETNVTTVDNDRN